jgi:hypothetical protein
MGRQSRLRKERRERAKSGASTRPTAAAPRVLPPVQVSMGPAGLPEFTTFVGSTSDGPLHDPAGSPGLYSGVLTLSRPGIRPLPEYEQRPSAALLGDSHIAIAKPAYSPPTTPDATEIRMTSAEGVVFSGLPNPRGFLSGFAVYPFQADNFMDAYVKAYARVAPSLSMWSAHLDVPIHVFQVDLLEIATGNTMIGYVNPFPELPLAIPPGLNTDDHFTALVSIYREALNSNSLPYQFLCFFKIAEVLLRRRDRLRKAADRGGAPYVERIEVVPADEGAFERWLGAIFPLAAPTDEPFKTMYYETFLPADARGKTFGELLLGVGKSRKGVLEEVRDLIAHALTSAERGQPFELVNLDDRLFHRRVHHWLPLMKVVARRMLKTDFPGEFVAHLPD